jgi:hypothetical protein
MEEGTIALLTVVFATATWAVTEWRNRKAQRTSHTADVLAALSTSERLAESSYQVTRLINAGARVSLSGIDPKTEAHVVDILDYYEFLCDLYASGPLSRKTITEVRGQLMKRTWDVCEPYIMETRAVQGRKVYSAFQGFVEELSRASGPGTTATPRDEARRLVDRLPVGATWDDVIRELHARRAVASGIADSDAGRTVPAEEVRRRFGVEP